MSVEPTWDVALEPERYELHEEANWLSEMDRREFLRFLGGGLLVLALFRDADAYQQPGGAGGRRRGGGGGGAMPREIGAWLHVAEDGTVTAYTGKAEVGQNIRTSLSQAVAEELRVPIDSVRLVMGDTERTPYDMGTFGSRTTPSMAPQLRKAAAAARAELAALSAERLGVVRDAIEVAGGKATDRTSGRSLGLGELTRGQKLVKEIDADATPTPAARWQIAGHPAAKVDGRAFVTGGHRYASDQKRPGMLVGKVLRPPAYGAKLVSLDAARAEAMLGVSVVRDGDFVGVAAPDEQTASRALAALRADWTTAEQPSDRDLFDLFKKSLGDAGRGEGRSGREVGSVADGLASSDVTSAQSYTIAYIAHAPLEPRAAVAEWEGDKLTVWTGTQRPFGVRGELAKALNVPEDRIRVIVPDTGAGYGGKHSGEAAVEAARLARAAGGPVRLVWTREEEFTWAYFRPAGVIDVKAGARKDGTLVAWEFHNVNSGASGIETPYEVPNRRVAFHPVDSPLRQGSYRALASTANHFAREMVMDELARAVAIDPLAFRLKNLKNDRLRAVLTAAAERFGWGRSKPETGRGFGIAAGTEKGGYVATCAEVAADRSTGEVRVIRIVTAFECGAIVNPDHLSNQVEGATVMGLGGALFEAIRFEDGKILNPRFSRYRVPRFGDVPKIDVVLLDRKDLPSAGAGETPIVAVAPAVGNAIFDASGVRARSLPMVPEGLKG
jgi:nicotinate dehydrogenase subunit B